MTTDHRWPAAAAPPAGVDPPAVVGRGDRPDTGLEDLSQEDPAHEHPEPTGADGAGPAWPAQGRVRWGVSPRAVAALAVVAVVVVAALVLRGLLVEPESVVQAAVDPAVAAVPAPTHGAAPGGEAPGPDPGDGGGAGPAASPASLGAATPGTQGPLAIHVVGAVAAPGVVEVPPGSRVVDAVAAAGGLTPDADPAAVNLARPLTDGEQVVVARPGETPPVAPVAAPPSGTQPGTAGTAGTAGSARALVDVNTAGTSELDALPGIGPVLAQRIVDFREANGPYASVDELVEVPGIGDAVLASLAPLVRA